MNWLEDLVQREERLRRRLAELAGREGSEPFERCVRPAIEEIQALLDDYLCGRSSDEKAWMSYEVRLNLPLFSHLRTLYCLSSAAEA